MTRDETSAVVLAGGRSRRFGRDKLAEPLGDRTLLERAIDAVRPVAVEIVVVTAPDDGRLVHGDVIVIGDAAAFGGPLVGLAAGLGRVSRPVVLVVGGDMPAMVPSLLQAMVERLADPAIEAVALEWDGRGRPLPIALRTAPAAAAAERLLASGERRLRAILESLSTAIIDEPTWRALDPDGATLRDVDTPADLHDWDPALH